MEFRSTKPCAAIFLLLKGTGKMSQIFTLSKIKYNIEGY
jgi:hypothetical protein